jgi:predicted XRE-type DNA-binding protein
MAKPFRHLLARMTPERRARVEAGTRALLAELPLHQLRQARDLTQQQLAEDLDITQPEVSKLEHRTDMYV